MTTTADPTRMTWPTRDRTTGQRRMTRILAQPGAGPGDRSRSLDECVVEGQQRLPAATDEEPHPEQDRADDEGVERGTSQPAGSARCRSRRQGAGHPDFVPHANRLDGSAWQWASTCDTRAMLGAPWP